MELRRPSREAIRDAMDAWDQDRSSFRAAPEEFTASQKTHIIVGGGAEQRYPAKPIYGRAAGYHNADLKGYIHQITEILLSLGFDVQARNGDLLRGDPMAREHTQVDSDTGNANKENAMVGHQPLNTIL